MAQAARYVDALAKPPGSLGRLEQLAIQLSGMSGIADLANLNKEIIVMCADHGVFDEGVAVTPKNVTAIQARNMQKGSPEYARWPKTVIRACCPLILELMQTLSPTYVR